MQFTTWFLFSAVVALLAALWLLYRGLLQGRNDGRPRCRGCWYDMTGLEDRTCPECGHRAANRKHLFRTRRRWGSVLLGVMLLAGIPWTFQILLRAFGMKETWYQAVDPTTLQLMRLSERTPDLLDRMERRYHRENMWLWQERWFAASLSRIAHAGAGSSSVKATTILGSTCYRVDESIDRLVKLLPVQDAAVRARAARALGGTKDRANVATPTLRVALNDPDSRVAEYAAGSLGEIGRIQLATLEDHEVSATLLRLCDMRAADIASSATRARELYLSETVRRRLVECVPALEERLFLSTNLTGSERVADLSVLTAIRRLRGQPDPVRIEIEPTDLSGQRHRHFATVTVHILNQDVDGLAVGPFLYDGSLPHAFQFPIRSRMRTVATDASGRTFEKRYFAGWEFAPASVSPATQSASAWQIPGLAYPQFSLPRGARMSVVISSNDLVSAVTPPGDYRVIAYFHNEMWWALLATESAPVRIVIKE